MVLVRKRGLEPLCLAAPPPQDGVSAISPLPQTLIWNSLSECDSGNPIEDYERGSAPHPSYRDRLRTAMKAMGKDLAHYLSVLLLSQMRQPYPERLDAEV